MRETGLYDLLQSISSPINRRALAKVSSKSAAILKIIPLGAHLLDDISVPSRNEPLSMPYLIGNKYYQDELRSVPIRGAESDFEKIAVYILGIIQNSKGKGLLVINSDNHIILLEKNHLLNPLYQPF
jgi:hypothetical protein